MKITIDIDCTPAEARAFFGLPDIAPMQKKMMAELEKQMLANVKAMDAETMFKTWLPASVQGFEQMQKMFWNQLGQGAGSGGGENTTKAKK
jgi:hypothetical protein